jgi:redox-sensitive bicupin YhaK (pirin superfamily)
MLVTFGGVYLYQQKNLDYLVKNTFNMVVSPDAKEQGVWIHQDAWLSLGTFDKETLAGYDVKRPGNGIYLFLLNGKALIGNEKLQQGDALAISKTEQIDIQFLEDTKLLIIDLLGTED